MKIINPTSGDFSAFSGILRWAQSVFKAMQHGVGIAQPAGTQDSAGRYNSFVQDNLDCVLLYIGANGSGATFTWGTNNVGQSFNHGLQRQPIGFIPVYKSKTCDIYSPTTPTKNNINLAITDVTTTTIVLVF
jgi:hypothetical protein